MVYYAAPKSKKDGPQSLDEIDPKLLETCSSISSSRSFGT